MRDREAFAWLLLAVIGVAIATHWTAVKAAWKYRDQLDQAGNVIDNLQQMGVLK